MREKLLWKIVLHSNQSCYSLVEMGRVDFATLLLGNGFPNTRQTNHSSGIHQAVAERVAHFPSHSINWPFAWWLAQKRWICRPYDCDGLSNKFMKILFKWSCDSWTHRYAEGRAKSDSGSPRGRERQCRQQAVRKLMFQCATKCTCDGDLSSPPAFRSAAHCCKLWRALNCTSPSTMECRHILSRSRWKASRWSSCSRRSCSCLARVLRCLKPRWKCFLCHLDPLSRRRWKLSLPSPQGHRPFYRRHPVPTKRCRCQCVAALVPTTRLRQRQSRLHPTSAHRRLSRWTQCQPNRASYSPWQPPRLHSEFHADSSQSCHNEASDQRHDCLRRSSLRDPGKQNWWRLSERKGEGKTISRTIKLRGCFCKQFIILEQTTKSNSHPLPQFEFLFSWKWDQSVYPTFSEEWLKKKFPRKMTQRKKV